MPVKVVLHAEFDLPTYWINAEEAIEAKLTLQDWRDLFMEDWTSLIEDAGGLAAMVQSVEVVPA